MEAKLQHLMVKGHLPQKVVAGWRALVGEVVPHP
jgi:hypothetical protein